MCVVQECMYVCPHACLCVHALHSTHSYTRSSVDATHRTTDLDINHNQCKRLDESTRRTVGFQTDKWAGQRKELLERSCRVDLEGCLAPTLSAGLRSLTSTTERLETHAEIRRNAMHYYNAYIGLAWGLDPRYHKCCKNGAT